MSIIFTLYVLVLYNLLNIKFVNNVSTLRSNQNYIYHRISLNLTNFL